MNAPISTLQVKRFRSLRDLTVGPFGQVNLITGKNNAGKSSLLEAIRILVTEGATSTLQNILNYREEGVNNPSDVEQILSPDDTSSYSSLFTDFPNIGGCSEPFTVSNHDEDGESAQKTISIRVGWFSERTDPETGRRVISAEDYDLFGESIGFPALEIEAPNRRRIMRIDSQRPYRRMISESGEGSPTPCIFLDPFSSRSTSQLGNLWDSIALTDAEKEVVTALKIISPDIEAVSMIGSDSGSRSRTAIAKSHKYPTPIPLRTFGDGVNRLFGIILSLSSAKGGVLLVDEIENGLHHSILTKVWKVIFQMARTLNVQVFATSHSWDCIESFQDAANSDPGDGVLVRLTANADTVVSTLFREDELKIAARNQIELR
jgi:AAA domain, putative AbiEii toxin, Type IV TA system/AAA ATPase domain